MAVRSIGKSHEGRDIWVATVTNIATGAAADKPAFWADGNIHAAELTASTTVLYYLNTLVTQYGSDGDDHRSCSTAARSTSARASTPTAPSSRSPTGRATSARRPGRIRSTRRRSRA